MRLFNSPFTKTGEVRYFELFKILVLVMVVVMSFSFISNQIEVHNYMILSVLSTILGFVLITLLMIELVIETASLIAVIKSYILPLLTFGYNINISIETIIVSISKFMNNLKPRSDYSRLCVMRC